MDIDLLSIEITNDPLVRGYAGMTDLQVADDMSLVNRPDDNVTIERLIKFLLLENTYNTDGNDTQDRSIWLRMKEVSALTILETGSVANPWGSTDIGTITEIQLIKTNQLLEFFTLSAQGNLDVDISDSNFQIYLSGAESAGCMSTSQKNALIALADNRQSRGQELGIGTVREGNVAEARA